MWPCPKFQEPLKWLPHPLQPDQPKAHYLLRLLDVTYMQSGPNFDAWVLQRQTVPAGLPRAGSKIVHLKKMAPRPSQICAVRQNNLPFTVESLRGKQLQGLNPWLLLEHRFPFLLLFSSSSSMASSSSGSSIPALGTFVVIYYHYYFAHCHSLILKI